MTSSFADSLTAAGCETDGALDRLLPNPEGPEARLYEAMRYSILAGGKRFRPFLVLCGASLFDVPRARALNVAAATEMVHCYSLIHDDLPAMDNDDLRRGKPTCHVAFDEATAILAGDALLTLAFEVLSDAETHPDANVRCRLVAALARAIGGAGMVGGQLIDLMAEQTGADLGAIAHMESLKTGALISFACEAGAILAEASESEHSALREFALASGLAFQIADDLLDVEGKASDIGKTAGKDIEAGKATFVAVLGVEGARERAFSLVDEANAHLSMFGARAEILRDASRFVVHRHN